MADPDPRGEAEIYSDSVMYIMGVLRNKNAVLAANGQENVRRLTERFAGAAVKYGDKGVSLVEAVARWGGGFRAGIGLDEANLKKLGLAEGMLGGVEKLVDPRDGRELRVRITGSYDERNVLGRLEMLAAILGGVVGGLAGVDNRNIYGAGYLLGYMLHDRVDEQLVDWLIGIVGDESKIAFLREGVGMGKERRVEDAKPVAVKKRSEW